MPVIANIGRDLSRNLPLRLSPAPLLFAALICGGLSAQSVPATIVLEAPDSGSLPADSYGTGSQGIILIGHGGYSTRESWAATAQLLADSGFRVLVFETRAALTLREGQEAACLYEAPCMSRDVRAAVSHLRAEGVQMVTVVGGSAGGGAAAQAAAEAPGMIDRLILLAPMSIDAPERISGRKLFLVAREDRGGDERLRLPAIQRQYDLAPEPKELLLFDGSAHGQRLLNSALGPAVLGAMLRFLRAP